MRPRKAKSIGIILRTNHDPLGLKGASISSQNNPNNIIAIALPQDIR